MKANKVKGITAIVLLTIGSAGVAFAYPGPQQNGPDGMQQGWHQRDHRYQGNQQNRAARFKMIQKRILWMINRRQSELQQGKACVTQATDFQQLRNCRPHHQHGMQGMRNQRGMRGQGRFNQ